MASDRQTQTLTMTATQKRKSANSAPSNVEQFLLRKVYQATGRPRLH